MTRTHLDPRSVMAIRARFYVAEFNEQVIGGDQRQAKVVMRAVTRKTDDDNIDWARYSPSGEFWVMVSNQAGGAFESFHDLLGKDVSILISPIPAEDA
jgi:hypothetical protein